MQTDEDRRDETTDLTSAGELLRIARFLRGILVTVDDKALERPLCLHHGRELYLVTPTSIRYVESRARVLKLHVADAEEPVSVYMTIAQLERELPETFVQCHKSYLVNLDYVFKLSGDAITLRTGEKIPVSQRKRSELVSCLCRYGREV